jgi:hypothetical protein
VCDPGDDTPANPNRAWRTTLSGRAIGRRTRSATGRDIGPAVGFRDIVHFPSGRIDAATVVGMSGSVRVSGNTLASALGLRDSKVWINQNRNVRGALRAAYDALGCAPHLPESPPTRVPGGVRQRFVLGALYRNGRTGRVVWLHGMMFKHYLAWRGAGGVLGIPTSGIRRVQGARGCAHVGCERALFARGGIYRKPDGPGVHAIFGRVFRAFWGHGGAPRLGFPVSGLRRRRNGWTSQTFERAVIRCPGHGRCAVRRRR